MTDVFILHVYMRAILYKYHAVSLFLFTCGREAVCIMASLRYGSMFLIFVYPLFLFSVILYYLVFHLEVVLYPFGDNLGLLAKL